MAAAEWGLMAAGGLSLAAGLLLLWALCQPVLQHAFLLEGRVSHSRVQPTRHAFSYGIFYVLLDLDLLDSAEENRWWPIFGTWPLSLARFCTLHHLHDARCRAIVGAREDADRRSFKNQVFDVVEHDTGKRPSAKAKMFLLTHLRYFGYFFSPVSFYYIYDGPARTLSTVVAEVSNTPWDEMHCYTLSPDNTKVEASTAESSGRRRFLFPKNFHVSPFMEMDYIYDWTFSDFWRSPTPAASASTEKVATNGASTAAAEPHAFEELRVTTAMYRYPAGADWRQEYDPHRELWFSATLRLNARPMRPLAFLYHLFFSHPFMTHVVQMLIHYEAFRLWRKKVPIIEHPDGAQTALSRFISAIMTPLYALEAWLDTPGHIPLESGKND